MSSSVAKSPQVESERVAAPRPRVTLRRAVRNRGILIGALVLILMVGASVFAPLLTSHDPIKTNPINGLKPPSSTHWFGTDNLGRDVFSRVLYGGRLSMGFGMLATALSALAGVGLGLAAGYMGGRTEMVIMRITDLTLAFPRVLLALMVVAVVGTGLTNVMIAVAISGAPNYIRVVRASVMQAKATIYVEAARSLGATDLRIVIKHILPNVMAPILVLTSLGLAAAIFSLSSLGFLGLGAQPPSPEWGSMVSKGRDILRVAWWMSTFPGLAIAVVVMGINLLGDGLRDIFDPRLLD